MPTAGLDSPGAGLAWNWRAAEFVELRREARLYAAAVVNGIRVARQSPRDPAEHVLLLPSDPNDVIGAVGDDAMITAIVGHFRARNPRARFTILCNEQFAAETVRRMGHATLAMPEKYVFPDAIRAIVETGRYDAFVGMGADVLDGHYGIEIAQKLLIAADVAARAGLPATLTGFSFAERADPALARYFGRLSPRVALNLRDAVSLGRLRAFARARPRLVADVAFTLQPAEPDPAAFEWVERQRSSGRQVIGFNLHPMLFPAGDAVALDRAVGEAAKAIGGAGDGFAWLLLPHDYRGEGMGDDGFLRPLAAALQGAASPVRYLEGQHPAASLKALAGHLDSVVTGRMHLAIAALGMGTPVLCAAYQDKFAGLLRHFALPEHLLANAATFAKPGAFGALLGAFLALLPDLREQVAERLPEVLALAEENFARPA